MELTELRKEIDAVDREILALFARRMTLSGEIARVKAAARVPVFDPRREEEKLQQAADAVPPEFSESAQALYRLLMAQSRKFQEKLQQDEVK